LAVCVKQLIMRHAYDEYLILIKNGYDIGAAYSHSVVVVVGTLKTGYLRIQALSQGKEQDVYPRAATQAVASGHASLLRWASAPPHVLRLQLRLPSPRQLRGRHVSCGSSSRCPARGSSGAATCPAAPAPAAQPEVAPRPPRTLWLQLPLPSPGQLRSHHVCLKGPTVCVLLK
jgi:hypothetical protein